MGLLERLERRASPENPSTSLSNPDAWLWDAFGAHKSKAGRSVSPRSALALSAYFACIRVVSETLATLPKQVYERADRGRQRRSDHPAEYLIDTAPNPLMTSVEFFETIQAHVSGWGNGYAEMELNGRGEVIALWPLMPDRTSPSLDGSGQKLYTTQVKEGNQWKWVTLPGSRVLHIHGLGFDGLEGYSVATVARESIGLALAAEEFGSRFFSNGANMGLLLTHPSSFKKPETRKRIKEQIEAMAQGLEKAHRVALLEEGMKLERMGIPQHDSQYMELRQFQVLEICRWFRMQPHKIQELGRATWNNVEQQSIEFVTDCMLPQVRRWEQRLNRSLFSQREGGRFYFRFNLEGLLRGDLATRYAAYAIGRQWGWLSTDDVREREEMNALADGIGSRYLIPMNMVPADRIDEVIDTQSRATGSVEGKRAGGAGADVPQLPAGAPAVGAFRVLLTDFLQRGVRREAAELRRLCGIWRSKRRSPSEILAEVVALQERDGDGYASILAPLELAFPGVAPVGFARACAERQALATAEQLEALLSAGGEPVAAIEARLAEWECSRADVAARVEIEAIEAGRTS